MVKRCKFCERYFTPNKRVEDRQKACSRKECQRASKQLSQSNWVKKNPNYFKGRYEYVKEWRAKRKEAQKEQDKRENMIQDKIPSSKPLYKLVFLMPGGVAVDMIQDEIIFKRHNRRTFVHYG